jgi:hypothetical protein
MLGRSLVALACLASLALPARAQDAACDDTVDVDKYRYLRQLTLDLKGRVPTEDELKALDEGEVDEALVDDMLDSPDFSNFVRRHHLDLLWPNIDGLSIVDPGIALLLPAQFYEQGGDQDRLFILIVGLIARGGLVPCKDEPAEYDDEGDLVFERYPDGTRREGWVMVEPYWAPGTEVKVCALEARINDIADNGAACDTAVGMYSGSCGCGPNLQHCLGLDAAYALIPQFREQMVRTIDRVIREGRPYTDIFLDSHEPLNGPLIHYYKHLAQLATDPIVQVPPVPVDSLPDRPFNDMSWSDHERGHAEHAGILTSMSYLLRFQTARSRANRFYTSFLCSPFVAPPGGLPSPNDECSQEPNLRMRCGCAACHTTLEPAAAYWGRFAEAGTMYLDPAQYPVYSQRCAECAREGRECDFVCNRFYVSEIGHPKQAPFAGVLKSYEWRDRQDIENLEAGPKALVQKTLQDGRLSSCVAQRAFERLYRRPMTEQEQIHELPKLARAFRDGGYDFRALVKTLVTAPGYRRMVR